ncbi:MAG: MmcB family DNA repair protein [archaeon]
MSKITAKEIKRALLKHHDPRESTLFFEVKNGDTFWNKDLLIMDALEVKKSWKNPCLTGYEIKTSHADFIQDEKWHGYLKYCHKFYFICPRGVIEKKEIEQRDDTVGLIYYSRDYKDDFYTMKAPVYKNKGLPDRDMVYYILMSKVESDRYPFHSSKKEYFKDWLENKEDNRRLGIRLKEAISEEIYKLTSENKRLKRKIKKLESKTETVNKLVSYFKDKGLAYGLNTTVLRTDWKKDLDRMFNGLSRDDIQKIKRVINDIKMLENVIEGSNDNES